MHQPSVVVSSVVLLFFALAPVVAWADHRPKPTYTSPIEVAAAMAVCLEESRNGLGIEATGTARKAELSENGIPFAELERRVPDGPQSGAWFEQDPIQPPLVLSFYDAQRRAAPWPVPADEQEGYARELARYALDCFDNAYPPH